MKLKTALGVIIFILVATTGYLWNVRKNNENTSQKQSTEINEQTPETIMKPTAEPKDTQDNLTGMSDEEIIRFTNEVVKLENDVIQKNEDTLAKAGLVAMGELLPRFRPATGQALLLEFDGQKVLRFENLEIANGPSLHVYLSKGLNNENVIDLGENLATKGDVNYSVPASINIKEYHYVLIWSQKYSVLFAYTDLQTLYEE